MSVINTKAFQRLRYTKQLSFCDWYFPGGTHTRFEHSLGVFDVVYKAIGKLVHDQCFRDQFKQKNINGVLLAALIHDIGHYPFAHVIEHYIASRFPDDKILKESVHHNPNTLSIINNDNELKGIVDNEWGQDILIEVEKILSGNVPILSDLLDGPIDCDKLDYLRRDSHHTGVGYADGVNVGNVVASYCCVRDGKELGISRAGIASVEGFMVVQDQMLSAVYWHETIRSVMAMFHRFLDVIVGDDTKKLIKFAGELKSCLSDHEAIYKVVIPWLEKQPIKKKKKTDVPRKELEPLIGLHIKPSFNDIYVCIAKYSNLDAAPSGTRRSHLVSIYGTIKIDQNYSASALPIRWDAVKALRACFQKAFTQNTGENIGLFEVVVDVPWGKTSGRMVYIRGEEGEQDYMITDVSHLKATIFDQQMAYNAPIRIFISPALFERHRTHLASIVITAEEMFYEKRPKDEDG